MSEEFSPSKPPEVFISYAHEDESLKDHFIKHLAGLERQGVIVAWHDRKIVAGENWQDETNKHLNTAEIILLLVSANFLASGYAYGIEFKRAMHRHQRREARVIPVILSPCDWRDTPLGELQALPHSGKPIVQSRPRDAGFANVVEGLREVIKQQPGNQGALPAKDPVSGVTPIEILRSAIRAVPAVKFALGVVGIVAAAAIGKAFISDYRAGLVVVIVMLFLMFGLKLFSEFAKYSPSSLKYPALALAWVFVFLMAASWICIFTIIVFRFPQPLEEYFQKQVPAPTPSTASETGSANDQSTLTALPGDVGISITEVPPYDPVGGASSTAPIAGKVSGIRPADYKVVIYSLTITWYVQPTTVQPKTEIKGDGTWKATIQLGSDYAAVLVHNDYKPPYTTGKQPTRMRGVVAATQVQGNK